MRVRHALFFLWVSADFRHALLPFLRHQNHDHPWPSPRGTCRPEHVPTRAAGLSADDARRCQATNTVAVAAWLLALLTLSLLTLLLLWLLNTGV
jgi:hypothetical protein